VSLVRIWVPKRVIVGHEFMKGKFEYRWLARLGLFN